MNKPFLRLVAEDIQAKFGNDISDIAIVFNNKRPITYLKKHLVDVYQQAIWSPQFYTIQEYLGQSSSKTIASPLSQFFFLFELHNELLAKEGFEAESLEEFYPIAEIILSDFSQLDYDLIPIEQIYMELHDTTEIEIAFQHFNSEQQEFIKQFWQSFSIKGHSAVQQRFLRLWRRLPVLYSMFKEKLKNENLTTHSIIYREVAEEKAEDNNFYKKHKKVLFVGFNALNKAEARLFKKWQEEEIALFYFDVDAHYLDDKLQEAGLFIRKNIEQTGLINSLGDAPAILANRDTEINLYQCLGKNSEAKLIYDILTADNLNELPENKSAAILLADESLLVPLLQSLPDIKTNITTGYPLLQSPIFGLIDLWMETQLLVSHQKKSKIPYQFVETFLSHPLTKVKSKERIAIQRSFAEKQLFEIELSEIKIENTVVPNFFIKLSRSEDVLPSLLNIIESLIKSISTQDVINRIESNLLIEVKKVLHQLMQGFERFTSLSIAFQIGLIRKTLTPINSAIEGDPLKGLQIMGLLESRCLNFDKVYILGANDGILPKTSNSATFIPNNLRKAYGLPILENQDALTAYLFYRHFQYSDDIHLFYNGIVDDSSTGEESRFIKQIEFETKFIINKHLHQQPLLFPERPAELIIEKKDQIWNQLYKKYIVDKKALSASAFTTYLQSPLQFFFKYVADIKEPPSISQEFEMNKLGTLIHESMEKLLLPYKGSEDFISTKSLKDKISLVDNLLVKEIGILYANEYQVLEDLNSLQRIMHKIASEYVKMYLQYDIDQYESFRIIELENDKDYFLDLDIEINAKTEKIKLYGIIDRVDEVITKSGERKLRIVDYKTGSDSVIFNNLDKVFSNNTENKALLQTLFYAHVFEQLSGFEGLEPHLYVARRMREDGTLFRNKSASIEFSNQELIEQKERFINFLKCTLEELFNPEIPFKHNADSTPYPSDPYTLFYRYSMKELESEEEIN